ncbi:uncharacterized protein LOC110636157 isoform X2 [Hevea brasiliensis]|uniref:uncharacterized protein LOC110636157 isoform X2 n=1 Tax=Hevea brasiliensis TaxID=3981 RepID=UPI000B78E6C9|nr:uncharacterized protein LOC110636157 isoform X2 [Hevea brasiliensis]
MPFPMKIQPIDIDCQTTVPSRAEPVKPVLKSRLKRLFDRQFPSVLRISSVEKPSVGEAQYGTKDGGGAGTEFEPSSVCLAKMVQNYIEESNEKPFRGRHRCNCFNGNTNDSSDDEFDVFGGGGFGESISNGSSGDASDILKSLIPCASVHERNLLADAAMIVEKNKNHKQKDDLRNIVADGLSSLGYDSSICKSKWDKCPSHPAGEYEYVDVNIGGERLLIDIDFRSEFEIARSTGAYKAILQSLPSIFVGKSDRLGQIVSIVSEAAKQSLKKKGMHFPPWRTAEYMRAKWFSPFTRLKDATSNTKPESQKDECLVATESSDACGELELIFGEKTAALDTDPSSPPTKISGDDEKERVDSATWQPPAVKPKSIDRGAKMVTGLASLLKEKP